MKSLVIDKIDVDEMLKHRALNSEKGAKFCGDHRTDCIIQQLDQNKKFQKDLNNNSPHLGYRLHSK